MASEMCIRRKHRLPPRNGVPVGSPLSELRVEWCRIWYYSSVECFRYINALYIMSEMVAGAALSLTIGRPMY